MDLCRALAGLLLASLLSQACSKIIVQHAEDKVLLSCNNVKWLEGTQGEMLDNETMDLGKSILDPRGLYKCQEKVEGDKKNLEKSMVQVYYRMCQNCVELDFNTMIGILVANVIATLLLALGVYCFAGHELGRVSGAH